MLASFTRNTLVVLSLPELYETLQAAIWSELHTGQDIPSLRRNLQREYLRRIADGLVRPVARQPADARALKRESAVRLQKEVRLALGGNRLSREARAHLNESLNTLSEALGAGLSRPAA